MRLGYHKLRVRRIDISKTGFQTRYGHFVFSVKSFGLTSAPTTFIDLINKVFRDYLDSFVIVFIDDILVCSKNEDEDMGHLMIVLQVLKEHKLFAK